MIMKTHVFEDNYFIKRYSRVPNASVKHTINVHRENSILYMADKGQFNVVEKMLKNLKINTEK